MRPLVIPNARQQAPFAGLAVTTDRNIGSYIGVPLVLSSGEVYGTLCGIDPQVHTFSAEDAELLVLLARFLAFQIERDQLLAEQTAVLDAAGEAMVVLSPDRTLRLANRRFGEVFGVSPKEVEGRPFEEVGPHIARAFGDAPEMVERLAGAVGDVEQRLSEMLQQVWPEARDLSLSSSPVRNVEGEYQGRLYAFRDVTHEREMDRLKNEFVSLVSHELRTPLTSIKGYVDLLMEEETGTLDDQQREFLEVVKRNADRLVALINDLLDLSRIEAGRLEVQRVPVRVQEVIKQVGNSLRPQLDAKHQRLELELERALPAVLGDSDRLTQILTNLLSNAAKYTPSGGRITVMARCARPLVEVAVRDTGIGMTPEEQAQVFTKFFRSRNKAAQAAGGTGLGLAITRQLVELHGGTMSFESEPGQGSTFRFTLPVAPFPAGSWDGNGQVCQAD